MTIKIKHIFFLLVVFLYVTHTEVTAQPKKIMFHRLTEKKGLTYAPNQKKPFTGTVFANYKDRGRKLRGSYKNGLRHGLWTHWNDEGKKEREESYKLGKKDGNWTYFDENGIRERTETFLKGKPSGKLTYFYSVSYTHLRAHET